jgi:nickel-dependent lactate racemase
VFAKYRVENHDCDSPDLVDMGTLSTGNRFLVNRTVADADLRLAIGEVLLHYYAGFAGGRKSILPGVAGRETVMTNHRMMTAPGVGIGVVEGNVLSEEMVEAAGTFCPLHFILNCVSDSSKHIVRVVGGHWHDAWREGIKTFRQYNFAPISRKADVVFLSAGGFPKDINMYQAHKALYMASRAVRPGGTMVFFAELAEGYGHKVFEEWAKRRLGMDGAISAFEADFRFGAHKLYYLAKLAKECTIKLYSKSGREDSALMFCEKIESVDEILPGLREKYGSGFTSYIIPQGGIVLPMEEK